MSVAEFLTSAFLILSVAFSGSYGLDDTESADTSSLPRLLSMPFRTYEPRGRSGHGSPWQQARRRWAEARLL